MSIDKVPYGIRWLCKATKVLVQVYTAVIYQYVL